MAHEQEIQEIVDRETRAWDTRDVDLLLSIFHPDMVWPFPLGPDDHDPMGWGWGMGRFDERRWRAVYDELFATHDLVHNNRATLRASVSPEGDAGLAVVDVDILWRTRQSGADFHWQGRACKVYAQIGQEWKMTMHTGLLRYQAGIATHDFIEIRPQALRFARSCRLSRYGLSSRFRGGTNRSNPGSRRCANT